MALTFNGSSNIITGISVGGLPDGIVQSADLGPTSGINGPILQVVSTTKTDVFSNNSTTYTDVTGLSVDITPQSASNKVYINVDLHGLGSNDTMAYFELRRDSTSINIGDAGTGQVQASMGTMYYYQVNNSSHDGTNFLDSPNTTSEVTYKVRVRNQNNSGIVYVNRSQGDQNNSLSGRFTSTITVMEVSG